MVSFVVPENPCHVIARPSGHTDDAAPPTFGFSTIFLVSGAHGTNKPLANYVVPKQNL